MATEIEVCDGATISAAEVERVERAMGKLKDDNGAAHELTVTVSLRLHHEGKEAKVVADIDAEHDAAKDGFAPYDHEAFTAKEA